VKKRFLRRLGGKRRGFTLIELLIVLSILAVLAAVVVLALTGFIGRGEKAACQADEDAIQTAVYSWYYEKATGDWPVVDAAGGDMDIDWDAGDGAVPEHTLVPDYINDEPGTDDECDWEVNADGQVCKGAEATDTCPVDCSTACVTPP
jgi:prepilin-type N-terminal cleavage/methylation domain-containing protein